MTRIATSTAQQSALADIMRAQRELNTAQRQFSTGKIADDLKGFGGQSEMLTATRSVLARETSYAEAARRLEGRLDAQALAISELSDASAELREAITESIGLDDGAVLMSRIEAIAGRAASALNTKFAGGYLFGGGREDVPPLDARSLDDLAGPGPVADLFRNGDIRGVTRLQDGPPIETGVLANELGADLMGVLKAIKDFADANGGEFSEPLTEAERDFLKGQVAAAAAAFETVTAREAQAGLTQNRVSGAAEQAEARKATLQNLLADTEEADMAEVATKLQQAQLALQASAQAFSMLSRNSLLNYL